MEAARDRTSPNVASRPATSPYRASGDGKLRLIREHIGGPVPSGPLTEKTVKYMAQMIRRSVADPLVARVAAEIREQAARTRAGLIPCLWWWVKLHVHFLHHDKQVCAMLGECGTSNYQMLIEPRALLRLRSMQGDCAVFTMLIVTLARRLGLQTRIATIAADRRRPGEYTHVYGEVYMPEAGLWCPMDASHGTGPGWEVPARDIARKTEWDLDGNIVRDSRPTAPGAARGGD